MNIICFLILMLILTYEITGACTSLEEKAIRCDQHCIDKDEPESWLKDNKLCVCGNQSELNKPIFKVPTNLRKQNAEKKREEYEL